MEVFSPTGVRFPRVNELQQLWFLFPPSSGYCYVSKAIITCGGGSFFSRVSQLGFPVIFVR
jgi:hypothetical protein